MTPHDATAVLEATHATLDVWPGCRHRVTQAEQVVIASAPFQRLRRLRQMGLAFHAWPGAENTRASHSIGVSFWAAAYLEALDRSADAGTQAVLASARAALAPLSLDLMVRLFALLHDIDLLPLGHTLRYQSGAFAEGEGHPRLAACVAAIQAEAREQAFAHLPVQDREACLTAFAEHLGDAADALAGRAPGIGRLVHELVNSGLGADLMDFALRDSAAIHRPQARHDALVPHLRLVATGAGPRLALQLGEGPDMATRVSAVDDLYRARFEIFAASVYHPVKLAADAMLDFVLRRLGPARCRAQLPQDELLRMGDDAFIDSVVAAEQAAEAPVARWMRDGQLHEEAWRTEDLARFRGHAEAPAALALAAQWRSEAEQRLRERLAWAADGDVIVAVSAPTMQAKPASALLCGPGAAFTLGEAGSHGFAVDAPRIAAQYARLWSLRVYVSARWRGRSEAVRVAAEACFGDARQPA